MTNEEHIEEMLFEAESLGLRESVLNYSKELRQLDNKLTLIRSYEIAYSVLIANRKDNEH